MKQWLLMVALVLANAGCALNTDLPYYWQSARGQLAVLHQARPIDELLAQPALEPRLRQRLALARDIRRFASRELGLPDNGSYTRYADLGRPFVVWNIFAAPELSLQLKQWCFPVAGCVSYRGYFDRQQAEADASRLREQGWETYVAGVPAYSTLGWFDDPLLNTFIHYPEAELARLIFHELAHQVVYLKGDSAFNESFATAVEEAGVERWLAAHGDAGMRTRYAEFSQRRRQFVELLRRHRGRLELVFGGSGPELQRREAKQQAFQTLRAEYEALKLEWGGFAGYDRWFAQPLGNAHLAAVATYTVWVPGFRRLLAEQGGDLPRFFELVRRLTDEPSDVRTRRLAGASLTLSSRAHEP